MRVLPPYFFYKHDPNDPKCIVVLNWINAKFNSKLENVPCYYGADLMTLSPVIIQTTKEAKSVYGVVSVKDIYPLVKESKTGIKYSIY